MGIEEAADSPAHSAGQPGEDTAGNLHRPATVGGRRRAPRGAPVRQRGTRRRPVLLEGDEPGVVAIGSPQIQLTCSPMFGVLDRLPEEKGHPAQVVQARIRAPVLVDDTVAVNERQNAGRGPTVLGDDPDAKVLADALDEVAKPRQRLKRHLVTPAREVEHVTKLSEQRLAPSLLVCQPLALRSPDLPLNRVLVKTAQESIEI